MTRPTFEESSYISSSMTMKAKADMADALIKVVPLHSIFVHSKVRSVVISRIKDANSGVTSRRNVGLSFFATACLLLVTLYYLCSPSLHDNQGFLSVSLYVMVVGGGIVIWLPVTCRMRRRTIQSKDGWQESNDTPQQVVIVEKPPEYESLSHPAFDLSNVAPPAYEDIFHITRDIHMLLPNRDPGSIGMPPCPVHQPVQEHTNNIGVQGIRPITIVRTRSRSMVD